MPLGRMGCGGNAHYPSPRRLDIDTFDYIVGQPDPHGMNALVGHDSATGSDWLASFESDASVPVHSDRLSRQNGPAQRRAL